MRPKEAARSGGFTATAGAVHDSGGTGWGSAAVAAASVVAAAAAPASGLRRPGLTERAKLAPTPPTAVHSRKRGPCPPPRGVANVTSPGGAGAGLEADSMACAGTPKRNEGRGIFDGSTGFRGVPLGLPCLPNPAWAAVSAEHSGGRAIVAASTSASTFINAASLPEPRGAALLTPSLGLGSGLFAKATTSGSPANVTPRSAAALAVPPRPLSLLPSRADGKEGCSSSAEGRSGGALADRCRGGGANTLGGRRKPRRLPPPPPEAAQPAAAFVAGTASTNPVVADAAATVSAAADGGVTADGPETADSPDAETAAAASNGGAAADGSDAAEATAPTDDGAGAAAATDGTSADGSAAADGPATNSGVRDGGAAAAVARAAAETDVMETPVAKALATARTWPVQGTSS